MTEGNGSGNAGRAGMAYGTIPDMEKTTVYLDAQLRRDLAALSRRLERPQAELIREAIADYLARQDKPPLPSFVGAISVGGNIAEEFQELRRSYIDDVLRRKDGGRR